MSNSDLAATLWNPGKITLAIMTVDRNPQYVFQTVASLFASDPLVHRLAKIYLVVGSDNASYLQDLAHHETLTITPMDATTWDEVKHLTVHHRFNHNYHRCLSVPLGDSLGLCVCEDDVVFRNGFVTKLVDTLNEMAHAGLHNFVLAGYAAYCFDADGSLECGSSYCRYPADRFFGTQCMFYPQSVLPQVMDRIYRHGIILPEEPGDMLVKQYCVQAQNLYAIRKSIVQHVGQTSTGLGYFHNSPSFHESWPTE